MKLYNTLTRKIEEFKPINPPSVGLYSCGPTVYDYAHIGHARTYVFVDVLKKTLQYLDYKVRHVMNITDVGHLTSEADTGEDKVEKKARKEGKTAWEIASFYSDHFFKTIDSLNIQRADVICKATDYIPQMINLIEKLKKKGFTYKTSDGIYFDTSKFKAYGKLAKLKLEGLKEGARVQENPEKRNPTDFALWKFSPKNEKRQMEWDSPFGKGFPGWHIECSVMSMAHLGETVDIHTGGTEHIPIHHTNEIAQSEAVTGKQFVRFWLHAGHLVVEGKKMSKSLSNFFRLEDIEKKGFEPLALRYLFLTAHYRAKMNFEWQALESAQKALNRLRSFLREIKSSSRTELSPEKLKKIDNYRQRFLTYLKNDLEMPKVIALIWEVVKSNIPEIDKKELILEWDKVLGLNLKDSKTQTEDLAIDKKTKELIKEREVLRKEKKWAEADKVREEIEKKGYLVEDTSKGVKVKKKA